MTTKTILDLDPLQLKNKGIQLLILDFDGVLAAHAASDPLIRVQDWLEKAVSVFEVNQLFILSNQPTTRRKLYFASYFPEIVFIHPKRKKPYIDGIRLIIDQQGVDPQKVLLVDDRLLTGILAAEIAGIQGCYVRDPWIDWKARPIAESWYYGLRCVEQWLLARVSAV